MKFGVREICDVVFKAKGDIKIGGIQFMAGQPVLYIDSAKTSTIEGAATTVYAQGGRGNSNLIAWEGEKTLTFTVEDALLSPMGFAVLSGAGLFNAGSGTGETVYVHKTCQSVVNAKTVESTTTYEIDVSDALSTGESISATSPIFAVTLKDGSLDTMLTNLTISESKLVLGGTSPSTYSGKQVIVDFYVAKTSGVTEMVIDAKNFAGYYYVEASTLFRRESDGVDLAAEIIFPNVKIQSNFTFSMASTGDPSTFTFTMDAFPGYTRFDHSKKVLCAIQIVDEAAGSTTTSVDSKGNSADADKTYPLSE